MECPKSSSSIQLLSVGSLTNTGPVSLGASSYRGGDWYQGLMDEASISMN